MEEKNKSQGFKYYTDTNANTYYVNDILMCQQEHNTRITFIDTKMPLPISSILIKNEGMKIEYDKDKNLSKIEKCEIVIPSSLLPYFIRNLEIMKEQYQKYLDTYKNNKRGD